MNRIIKTLMIALLVAGTSCTSQAQDDDGKIKVKITKEVDGEKKTFEGEYDNIKEMRNDPAYQKFAEDEDSFVFSFGSNDLHERIFELHEGDGGARAFSFSFDDDNFMPMRHMKKFRFGQGGPGAFWFGDDDTMIDLFDSEEYEKELEEKMAELEEKLKGLDKSLREEIMESMEEIEEMSSGLFPRKIKRNSLSIEDVGDDFGRRGNVDDKNKLDIDDMDFIVMGKRLTVRFRVKEAGELTVKISNEAGKDIYNRYFEKFGGTFSDQIDFSKYSDGKYLLEITQDKKRLTKKIVIN